MTYPKHQYIQEINDEVMYCSKLYCPFKVEMSSSPSFSSLIMSSPPISSPFTQTCGYVGQLENFLRPCRMSSSEKMSKVENSTPVSVINGMIYDIGKGNILFINQFEISIINNSDKTLTQHYFHQLSTKSTSWFISVSFHKDHNVSSVNQFFHSLF